MAAISIQIDDDTKEKFYTFCDSVGLSVSAAFNIFAKTVVRERRIPFEIRDEDPFYSSENQIRLLTSIQHAKEGKVAEHEIIEVN